ncbi:error-prone DNA polymerase [Myxococcota bacterium]|nr:error-prone DNA polymerase [Myxococcota bacterium]
MIQPELEEMSAARATARYVELRTATAFSFLRGASLPEEVAARAATLGYDRIAITDRDGLYGIVRAHSAAKEHGLQILVGAEVSFGVGTDLLAPRSANTAATSASLVLIATDRASYGRLCRLLSVGRLRVGKGGSLLDLADVANHAQGLLAIAVGPPDLMLLAREKEIFGERLSISVERTLTPFDRRHIEAAQSASARLGIPLVATGGVLMHERARKPLQDILSCVRLGVRLDQAGRRLHANANAYLKSPAEMAAQFSDMPELLERSVELADRSTFRLDELKHDFTLELLPPGESGMSYLRKLVERGAEERYPGGAPDEVRRQIEHELKLIEDLQFIGYFLTVWDLVRFARSRGILCQGRGSAANSVVCYCLGITSIDPVRMNLLFERFISAERGEPPDIDVDFEHERREEVMQYLYEKYGRDHAAMVANVIAYRGKSAYREVGKVFGLGEDQIDRLSRTRGHWSAGMMDSDELRRSGLDPSDATVQQVVHWAETLQGFPRHLGLHSGGFIITRDPVTELVPVENATKELRTVISWDKRDVETLGLVKVDLLALGMLTAIRKTFEFVEQSEGRALTLATIPAEDPPIYAMIGDADTVGTFQVESRAQMQMLPRLAPKTFYDLVVAVAIVRPGPIQGDMIHPYLRRRDGLEAIEYPHPALEKILGRTYGVPLFQEQVMKMAVAVANFTPGEADELRRAIGWQSEVQISKLRDRLIKGMLDNGLELEYAERIFRMIQGFGGYGFPESHAASFALIGYASCYLKRYHPAAFLAGLLNSQPMGFYSAATLVADAQRHGIEIRSPCVANSRWDSTIERPDEVLAETWWTTGARTKEKAHTPWADHVERGQSYGVKVQPAVRIGLREVFGMNEAQARRIIAARSEAPLTTIADLVVRAELPRDVAARLASAGAFSCFGLSRREALWRVMALDRKSPLFERIELPDAPDIAERIPKMSEIEEMRADYGTTGMTVASHPMALVRELMRAQKIMGYDEVQVAPHGRRVRVGGMVVTRQRPGTASGVVFITLEDESGHVNLVVFSHVYERYRDLARDGIMLIAEGKLERTGKVINIVVDHFERLDFAPEPGVGVSRNFF